MKSCCESFSSFLCSRFDQVLINEGLKRSKATFINLVNLNMKLFRVNIFKSVSAELFDFADKSGQSFISQSANFFGKCDFFLKGNLVCVCLFA